MTKNQLMIAGVLFNAGFVNKYDGAGKIQDEINCLVCQNHLDRGDPHGMYKSGDHYKTAIRNLILGLKELGLDQQAVEAKCRDVLSTQHGRSMPFEFLHEKIWERQCIWIWPFIKGVAELLPPT